ncbi:MAG: DUF3179 domain-containing (seleno)protein, partial [Vicinamibacterales bacterium]
GAGLLALFEMANVYFIMPMPYSQRWHSIDIAYALHSWRWLFRGAAVLLVALGISAMWRSSNWQRVSAVVSLLLAAGAAYAANFVLAADAVFLQPTTVSMQPPDHNGVEPARLVVGIELNGDARAYPVQIIGYHHQVRDTVGGTPVMVTFCTVCRTGRVFSPSLDGALETFRLVGMDRFNAMFEDATTGSWWRQANGEAIAGPRKGMRLTDIPSEQMTLAQWLALHPRSLVMQPDPTMRDQYDDTLDYESGASRSTLTGTNPASWGEKSWVVGITVHDKSRAYDWNRLRQERVINDELGGKSIVLVLASDNASFFAFERPDSQTRFAFAENHLVTDGRRYDLAGRGEHDSLKRVFASQEFWHSWRTFQPGTDKY